MTKFGASVTMSMNPDVGLTVVLGIISAIVGYVVGLLFSLWKNRLRAWVTLLRFSEIRKLSDEVDVSANLSKSTKQMLTIDIFLPEGKTYFGQVFKAYELAKDTYESLNENIDYLESGISALKSASSIKEVKHATLNLLGNYHINNFLDLAIIMNEIALPDYDRNTSPTIKTWFNEKELDGCFVIPYKIGLVYFGKEMCDDPHRKELLSPMVELIARVDKASLIHVFEKLLPLWKTELSDIQIALKELEKLVDENSRWMAEFTVTNFGRTPIIIFPDFVNLRIVGEHVKEFKLPCTLLTVSKKENAKDDDEQIENISGLVLVKSETSQKFVASTDVQKNINDGDILRSAYTKSNPEAFVELIVLGRALPRKKKIKSTKLTFSEQ